MKKAGLLMNIAMGVSLSFILSFVGTLHGGHFTVGGWLKSFAISLAISIVISFVVPVKKVCDDACKKVGASEKTLKHKVVSALVSDLIYTPIITIIMVAIMVGGAQKAMEARSTSPDNKTQTIELSGDDQDTPPAKEMRGPQKPNMANAIISSLILCLIVALFVILIIEPIYFRHIIVKAMQS